MRHPLSVLIIACVVAATLSATDAVAQRDRARPTRRLPDGFPFSDPEAFFQQFFGEETEADRQALAKVRIAPTEESQIGNRAVEAYLGGLKRQGVKVLTRGDDVKYLQALVATLQPQMQNKDRYRKIRVYLADSSATDARSFPGGNLVFFRGLLDFAQTEAALIGVIGHELSHLDRGHQLDGVRRMKLAQKTFSSGKVSPQEFFRSGTMMMRMFMRPFRPEDESQADEDGATWAYRAGYDPRQMAELFRRLHRRDGEGSRTVPSFFRTHPYHIDRYRAVLELYDKLQSVEPKDPMYTGRENLKRRIPRSVRAFPE